MQNFITENNDFLFRMITESKTDPYWQNVFLVLEQLSGLYEGYSAYASENQQLTAEDLYLLNAADDLYDASNKYGDIKRSRPPVIQDGCSGLIKLTSTDLYVSQTAWTEFQDALRTLKTYTFNFKNSGVAATTISFSSYPGQLWSGDDFYAINSNLVVIETTCSVFNNSLWQNLTPNCVLTWVNVMASNRVATSAEQWTDLFTAYNSGTYTNQWIAIDYNHFTSGNKLPQDTVRVLEAIPGYTLSVDVSELINTQGYFGSYNTWFIPFIFNTSGYPTMVAQYGNWFTYSNTPRALIYSRNNSDVLNIDDMKNLMIYNNFETDPLSQGYPENAIAARSDLARSSPPPPFSALGLRCHGGIDSKVTSSELLSTTSFWAYGAMTHVQQPVFAWANSTICTQLNVSHVGLPDAFPFDWIEYSSAVYRL